MSNIKMTKKGFTLIELLVVISIIGILMAISIFGLQGARESSRDAKRKADLELIRSGIEIYKSDCDSYPVDVGSSLPSPLVGDGSKTTCAVANTYIKSVPSDPTDPTRTYIYISDGTDYEICASLEQGTDITTCGGNSNCGETCNYKVVSP